jgi:hypothetical protein
MLSVGRVVEGFFGFSSNFGNANRKSGFQKVQMGVCKSLSISVNNFCKVAGAKWISSPPQDFTNRSTMLKRISLDVNNSPYPSLTDSK